MNERIAALILCFWLMPITLNFKACGEHAKNQDVTGGPY